MKHKIFFRLIFHSALLEPVIRQRSFDVTYHSLTLKNELKVKSATYDLLHVGCISLKPQEIIITQIEGLLCWVAIV